MIYFGLTHGIQLNPVPIESLQTSPEDSFTLGWKILVLKHKDGELNGQDLPKSMVMMYFPPSYGVSSGPTIVISHEFMLSSTTSMLTI